MNESMTQKSRVSVCTGRIEMRSPSSILSCLASRFGTRTLKGDSAASRSGVTVRNQLRSVCDGSAWTYPAPSP